MEQVFYIARVLNGISLFCTIFAVIFTTIIIVTLIAVPISKYNEGEKSEEYIIWKVARKYSLIFGIIFIIASITIPDKKTYLLMMSGKVVDQTIVNNPDAKEIPEKTIKLINVWLEKEIYKDENDHPKNDTIQ